MLFVWSFCALVGILSFDLTLAYPMTTDVPEIYYLHVTSDIRMRFATTQVVSRMANHQNYSTEATFHVILPNEAFISNFSVEIDGVVYPGEVKEKEQARKAFEKAKRRGQSAGHVAQKPRDTNTFKVSINVAALSNVTFELRYQELLRRRLGTYEHAVYVNPDQPVKDMMIEIFLTESQKITYFRVPPLKTENAVTITDNAATNPDATWTRPTPKTAHVVYRPADDEQIVKGAFLVEYEVDRKPGGGEILAVNGYFVHFFAPKGFEALPKDILFILDGSGSMNGEKIYQLRQSMLKILKDLNEGDRFNIIRFSSGIVLWKPQMQLYKEEVLIDAIGWVKGLRASGGTNINDALLSGIQMLKKAQGDELGSRSGIVVFLTDGEATSGVTNKNAILNNVKRKNNGEFPVFGLSYGADADFKLLQKISLQNNAVARRIYEGSDITIQLKDFYDEISAALIADLSFEYLPTEVVNDSLTANTFRRYFNGTETVVAGKLTEEDLSSLSMSIGGTTSSGSLDLSETVKSEYTNIADQGAGLLTDEDIQNMPEKLWAYLTIKELENKRLSTDDATEKEEYTKKMLELSLKYKFVTPVTSMVVIKPEEEEQKDFAHTTLPPTPTTTPTVRATSRPQYGSSSRRGGHSHRVRGGGGATGDPHFIVDLNGTNICFDILGKKGDILDLVTDPIKNIYVRAEIVEGLRYYRNTQQLKTYMGRILISAPDAIFDITPHRILYNGEELSWKNETLLRTQPARVLINGRGRDVIIKLGLGRHFLIQRSLTNRKGKIDYLDFFVINGKGFSMETTGILGQFIHAEGHMKRTNRNLRLMARDKMFLTIKHRKYTKKIILVNLIYRRNVFYSGVPCWIINEGISELAKGEFFSKKPIIQNKTNK